MTDIKLASVYKLLTYKNNLILPSSVSRHSRLVGWCGGFGELGYDLHKWRR